MILEEKFTLSNGVKIPKLGLGTWFINDKDVVEAVKEAARVGYRHIDTAQAYGNESGVGEGIKTCGVKREDMFVTTKLAAEVKSYKEAVESIDSSLKKLGLDYIDLMIIHSPKPWAKFLEEEHYFEGNREAWRALEEAHKAGKLRSIGVSNFEEKDIDKILSSYSVKPMVNQILAHISPHTKIISILPVSPGALILFEGSMTFFFAGMGIGVSVAVIVTLLYRALSFWSPIFLGLVLYKKLETDK